MGDVHMLKVRLSQWSLAHLVNVLNFVSRMVGFRSRRVQWIILVAFSLGKHFSHEMHDLQVCEAFITRRHFRYDIRDRGIDFYLLSSLKIPVVRTRSIVWPWIKSTSGGFNL